MALLSTDELIDILADSKKVNAQIEEESKIMVVAEKQIDETRETFRVVAFRASILFFCINDLNNINDMYQYSLQWFKNLFAAGVKNSEPAEDSSGRIANLNDYFTLSLYRNVCRSLFERHKLLFSFLLCTKIMFGDNKIDQQEWRFFLAGPSGEIEQKPNPTTWLDDLEWGQMYEQLAYASSNLETYKGLDAYFIEFQKKFKTLYDATNPH
jgi:dynein heavy chain